MSNIANFGRAAFRAFLLAVPPCFAALYPLVFVVRSHNLSHLLGGVVIVRPALAVVGCALIVLLLFAALLRSARAASLTTTLFFVLIGLFPAFFDVRGDTGWLLSVAFTIASLVLALGGARLLAGPIGVGLSWAVAVVVVWTAVSTALVSTSTWPRPGWVERADRIIGAAQSVALPDDAKRPDIYHIILDGLGRADVLERLYGVDAQSSIRELEALGFRVPPRARSNYSQTQLSLASTMNMQYLDELAAVMKDGLDRRPLNRLIVESGVTRLLKRRGYEFIVVATSASITSRHHEADRCLCVLPAGPTELEHALLTMTPLGGRYLDRAGMAAHGREVVQAFDHVHSVRSNRPMFVMAHVISPHPPFVLAADGTTRIGQDRFTYFDGDGFPGSPAEYRAGYRAQATFVLRRLVAMAEDIIARSPGALIVVHADHGPGLGLVNTDVTRTNAWERLSIFSAYYAGGRDVDVPDDITPVNALRWALRTGLGADMPLLPNRSYLSDYARPYQWRAIPAAAPRPTDLRRPG